MNELQANQRSGFTLVELLIVIVVLGILVTLGVVSYNTVQRNAANSMVINSLKNAGETVEVELIRNRKLPIGMPDNFAASPDVSVTYIPEEGSVHYSDLSPVQNGVLFYNICRELITMPEYSTIHSADGNNSQTVMMNCQVYNWNNIQIHGWDSRTWAVPVSSSAIQSYIDSVPYDSWWIDKQDVIRAFHTELMSSFVQRGGSWPVTSFWDPWANQWSGVPKEDLPQPDPESDLSQYCIVAQHARYEGMSYFLTADSQRIRPGSCPNGPTSIGR